MKKIMMTIIMVLVLLMTGCGASYEEYVSETSKEYTASVETKAQDEQTFALYFGEVLAIRHLHPVNTKVGEDTSDFSDGTVWVHITGNYASCPTLEAEIRDENGRFLGRTSQFVIIDEQYLASRK